MDNVTRPASELSKVDETDPSVTSARDRTRERVRRHRALKKQAGSIEFVRTDASLFLHPDRLSQKAGAPKHLLRRMALKELVDNALDAAPTARLTRIDNNTFVVEDDGPGLGPERVLALFSVTRPMMSTKLIRRPTRGAVGNGLRVATAAAFASGGGLVVESRGIRQALTFDRATGETVVSERSMSDVAIGTRVTVRFGPALPVDVDATTWGSAAIRLAGQSANPMLTHPNWYCEAGFKELTEAARGTARDLARLFGIDLNGCNAGDRKPEQGQSSAPERYIDPDGPANQLSLDLLKALAPKPPKLIHLPGDVFRGAYKIEKTEALVAGAVVPAIVQVWALENGQRGRTNIQLIVNRTYTLAEIAIHPGGDAYLSSGGVYCGLGQVSKGAYNLTIAITTPAIALVTDGKTPDLSPFRQALSNTVGPALRRAHRPVSKGVSIKDAAFAVMEDAYLRASAGGTLPANARQIMYAARPFILEQTGQQKLNDAYFTQTLLPGFMDENPEMTAEWDVVYDARGHLVEPHTGHSLPLGTLHVREYLQRRPRLDSGAFFSGEAGLYNTTGPGDRYGAVLFIEKEGFEPLLRAARIAERFDIAIMSTKGMSVVAARALVDRVSSQGVKILVAHDLDISGIRIFGTLGSDSSRYRFQDKPQIHRLGLTLEQAEKLDLQAERQDIQGDHRRVLDGLRRHGATDDELSFLAAGKRVELNAMPSDQFIAWIEAGLVRHGVSKVVPSLEIIEGRARRIIGLRRLRESLGNLELDARRHADGVELPADLRQLIRREFESDAALPWEDGLERALARQ